MERRCPERAKIMMSNLLVSLCNLPVPGETAVLRMEMNSGAVFPLKVGSPLPIKSCTGLARDQARCFVLCQGVDFKSYLAVLNLADFTPAFFQFLPDVIDAHSLLAHQGRLYIVSTGSDAVIAYDVLDDRVANPAVIWNVQGDRSNIRQDTHHVNSIALWNEDIVVSAFGPKSGETWSTATKGYLLNLTQRTILAENLYQPHSLKAWRGKLYYCESARGRVTCLGDASWEVGQYTRGLDFIADDTIAFGSSVARKASKSSGLINNPSDPGEATGNCSVNLFHPFSAAEAGQLLSNSLADYGTEIYDLLCLSDTEAAQNQKTQKALNSASLPGSCTIIIPVYDAFDELQNCLRSIQNHLPAYANVVIVNDASSDARIAPMLESLARERPDSFKIISNDVNLGFPGAVNLGIESCSDANDVVILNSDTLVTHGWLDTLRRVFNEEPEAGIACPLSNNGTILSVPRFNQSQEIPEGFSVDQFQELVEQAANGCSAVEIPTAVGFCMYIRRAVIDAVGLLDRAFGRGYGEECDYSMRARQAGFRIVCAPSAFVYHRGESSFGRSLQTSISKRVNEEILNLRWPGYRQSVIAFCDENPLRPFIERIWRGVQKKAMSSDRSGILHVLHRGGAAGGVENHVRDLSMHCRDFSPQTILLPIDRSDRWMDLEEIGYSDGIRTVGLCPDPPSSFANAGSPDEIEQRFARLLRANKAQIVHFHHMIGWRSPNLPMVAKREGKVVVVSIHDYSYLCPNYNFALENGNACGKPAFEPRNAECERCLSRFSPNSYVGKLIPPAGLSLLETTLEIFDVANAIVFPSDFSLRRHRAAIGTRYDNKILIVPHSQITLPPAAAVCQEYSDYAKPGPVRVTFLGGFQYVKGADLFLAAARRLRGRRFVFSIVGVIAEAYRQAAGEAQIDCSGSYDRNELPALFARTDVICLLSRWDETYCLAFDEAMASGKVVIATAVGALPERFVRDEFSFLIAPNQYQTLVETLLHIQETQLQTRLPARRDSLPVSGSSYLQLYQRLASEASAGITDRATSVPSRKPWQTIPLAHGKYAKLVHAQEMNSVVADAPSSTSSATQIDFLIDCRRFPELAAATIDNLQKLGAAAIHPIWGSAVQDGARLSLPDSADHSIVSRGNSDINTSLPRLGRDWVLLIQAGDRLAMDFFEVIDDYLLREKADMYYWDEDLQSAHGEFYHPLHKPPFDEILLKRRPDLIADAVLVRRRNLLDVGGIEEISALSIALRAGKFSRLFGENSVCHIPRVCSHRSDIRHWDGIRADQMFERAREEPRVDTSIRPTIRIVVIAQDAAAIDSRLVQHYLNQQHVRVTCIAPRIINRSAREPQVSHHPRVLDCAIARSTGEALQQATKHLVEDYVLVCTDTIALPSTDFVARLIARMGDQDGIASTRICGPDGKIFSSGVLLGGGQAGVASFLGNGALPNEAGYFGLFNEDRHVGAVGEELALIRRDTIRSVCFDLAFEHHYTMVDFCIGARQAGWQTLCAGSMYATRTHDSRRANVLTIQQALVTLGIENERMLGKWGSVLANDPTRNPNLALQIQEPAHDLRFPVSWHGKPRNRLRVVASPFDNWGSGKYRVEIPLAELQKKKQIEFVSLPGHSAGYMPSISELRRADADVLLIHNPFHDYQIEALQAYKKYLPIRIVAGMDDLLTDLPDYNPYSKTIYPDIADRIRKALALCDLLVVSTMPLKVAYAGLIDHIEVIPNAINTVAWPSPCANKERVGKIRVGWAGANQHSGDLRLIAELVRLTRGTIDWVFLGMRPENIHEENVEFYPMVSFADYPASLTGLGLDLAVAPLVDNAFNRAKSNLKLLEYGICGIPVLCSDIEPYRSAPVWRVENENQAWHDMLIRLAGEHRHLSAAGKQLRTWVVENHSVEQRLKLWQAALSR